MKAKYTVNRNSVLKELCDNGITYNITVTLDAIGKDQYDQVTKVVGCHDIYMTYRDNNNKVHNVVLDHAWLRTDMIPEMKYIKWRDIKDNYGNLRNKTVQLAVRVVSYVRPNGIVKYEFTTIK